MLVLLPGLDGTGDLFARLLPALRTPATVVSYPRDRVLGYGALLPLVRAQLPSAAFVLVAESFSGPLAIRLAAEAPLGLRALVLAASFHRQPVGTALALLAPLVKAHVFRVAPPAFALRALLAGRDADAELVASLRAASLSVEPAVLASRVRAALEVDVSADLARVRVPIAYLAGRDDTMVRRAIPTEMRALVPSLAIHTLDAPHLVLQRRPEECAAVIDAIAASFRA